MMLSISIICALIMIWLIADDISGNRKKCKAERKRWKEYKNNYK